jgi:hypothetical protein
MEKHLEEILAILNHNMDEILRFQARDKGCVYGLIRDAVKESGSTGLYAGSDHVC